MKFKVGDKVTPNCQSSLWMQVGEECEIIKIDHYDEDPPYHVMTLNNRCTWWFCEIELDFFNRIDILPQHLFDFD